MLDARDIINEHKMTLKEALERLKMANCTLVGDREALDIVLEEAKKRIPLPPKVDDKYIFELCPSCDDFVRLPHSTPMNFCCNCGQRLLWWEDEKR